MTLSETIFSFQNRKLLVIGDVMLDRYLYGQVNRISPEAPVPVLDYGETVNKPGGAANVALNVKAMGGRVALTGLVGNDEEGELFAGLLRDAGIGGEGIVITDRRRTTLKTRVMARDQHLLRVDREDKGPVDEETAALLHRTVIRQIETEQADGIILQDYNKGVLSASLIREIVKTAREKRIPVFVDPKRDNISAYAGCTLFKPNLHEARQITGLDPQLDTAGLEETAESLRRIVPHDISLITLSDKGLYAKEAGRPGCWVPSVPQEVTDVCGAGDSVISALALSYLTGADIESMAKIGNIAGHVACRYPGVVPVRREELETEVRRVYENLVKR